MAKKQLPVTPIRLPAELKKHLKAAAEKNQRSLNSEVIFRLTQTQKAESNRGNAIG